VTRHPHLDAVRGSAALLVVMEHARCSSLVSYAEVVVAKGPPLQLFYAATGMGHSAVMMFFALSGYLVGGPMIEQITAQRFSMVRYAIRRMVRLWIVIIPALLFTLFFDSVAQRLAGVAAYDGSLGWLVPSLPRTDSPAVYDIGSLLGNVAFLQTITVPTYGSNGPLWSLANEFWYYVLGPLVVLAGLSRRAAAIRILAGLSALAIALWLPTIILILGLVWAAGAVAFQYPRLSIAKRTIVHPMGRLALCTPAALALVVGRLPDVDVPDVVLGLLVAVALPAAAAMPSLGRWYEVCSRALADISYSLYLTHFPLIVAISAIFVLPDRWQPDLPGIALFACLVFVALAWAAVIYALFESRTDLVYRQLSGWISRWRAKESTV
jgi:peptidoglycan/LPS O-acetylase OafA/YrhL